MDASKRVVDDRASLCQTAARLAFVALLQIASLSMIAGLAEASEQGHGRHRFQITILSSKPYLVSGGDALVRVDVPPDVPMRRTRVLLNRRDVTDALEADDAARTLTGLVTGLNLGRNLIEAVATGHGHERPSAELEVTNYPITGPLFSGPQIQPYLCMTDQFILPDGSYLGPWHDEFCSADTNVQYVYKSTAGDFRPMSDTTTLPPDVVTITTQSGVTVPYVVRFEAGTIDRGVYNIAILHDPTTEAPPSPTSPPEGWNKKLLWVHGFGCVGGWYYQGTNTGTLDGLDISRYLSDGILKIVPRTGGIGADFNVINDAWLSKGYAIATNTLNHPSISCNPHLAGEATTMTKEHFVKEFGVPLFTASTGGSGGAYSSLQIADAFPGLFDGVLISAVFPDALSIGLSGLDGHLLTHYFAVTDPNGFTDEQKTAVSGYQGVQALIDAANQAGRTDPVSGRMDIRAYMSGVWTVLGAYPLLQPVPPELRYDPSSNPTGARPTIFDVSVAVYGKDPQTGFALRPYDNTGVQYGLGALNSEAITPTQFLNLNENVGGYDADDNYVPSRTLGNADAIERTYESGISLGGSGGLASIPVFDFGAYNEHDSYHYQWFHFAVRQRLIDANGDADNEVIWRGSAVPAAQAIDVFDQWMTAVASDTSDEPLRVKTIRDKPARAMDGCWASATEFIAEPQTWSSEPDSQCNTLFPSYAFPRYVAGGVLAGNVLRCQLKPIDLNDYQVVFMPSELSRLQSIFPSGVCDWSKPGVNQTGVVPWASFGPSPVNLVFDVTRQ
ncbi:MAG TPA: DUF6351 family protein [Myxococcaceae bacterium]|nr:DUF6351 family protein [Myxococcaceae bacterium]